MSVSLRTVHRILQTRILEWVAFPLPGDLPNPGIEPMSPPLQEDYLPAEPQGKPKNTGVGSLFLLQVIFPMQDEPRSPALQGDTLPTVLSGKPALYVSTYKVLIKNLAFGSDSINGTNYCYS